MCNVVTANFMALMRKTAVTAITFVTCNACNAKFLISATWKIAITAVTRYARTEFSLLILERRCPMALASKNAVTALQERFPKLLERNAFVTAHT